MMLNLNFDLTPPNQLVIAQRNAQMAFDSWHATGPFPPAGQELSLMITDDKLVAEEASNDIVILISDKKETVARAGVVVCSLDELTATLRTALQTMQY